MHYFYGVLSYELLIDSVIGFLDGLEMEAELEKHWDANFRPNIDIKLVYPVCEVDLIANNLSLLEYNAIYAAVLLFPTKTAT